MGFSSWVCGKHAILAASGSARERAVLIRLAAALPECDATFGAYSTEVFATDALRRWSVRAWRRSGALEHPWPL